MLDNLKQVIFLNQFLVFICFKKSNQLISKI